MFKLKIIFFTMLLISNTFANNTKDDTLGNIAIQAGIWKTSLGGNIINNAPSITDFKNDLNYKNVSNITSFGLDLKNDYSWLPNFYVDYFSLNNTADSVLSSAKIIDGSNFTNSISTSTKYSEVNAIVYGYFAQDIFEFDLGVNIKKISYSQVIKENSGSGDKVIIDGPNDVMILVYGAVKMDLYFINTVLKAELSTFSVGDNEANSYKYSINYRMLDNMYISYGYRYNSWKATNSNNIHEKYNVNLSGNYINIKILF